MGILNSEYDRLRKRLSDINDEIANAQHWGAKLSVLIEERNAILRNLAGTWKAESDDKTLRFDVV